MNEFEKMCSMLRQQAWDRAKGELKSISSTYFKDQNKADQLWSTVEEFIKKVEDEGLHE